jgi:hypothetical protein
MYLVEAKRLERSAGPTAALQAAIEGWEDFPASELGDHGKQCCRIARQWLLATDCARQPAGEPLAGPRWIRQRVTWGPSRWPVYWCEAVSAKVLDCGALAALATEAFRGRRLTCYTAQMIQLYSEGDSCHWYASWERAQAEVHWIRDELVYHEGSAVVVGDSEIRIWDATAGWWADARQVTGYSGVLAVRVVAPERDRPPHFVWGTHRIPANRWQALEVPGPSTL